MNVTTLLPNANVSEILRAFERSKMPCTLCGGNPVITGVFETKDALFGTRPGKTRYIFYSLCEKHQPREGGDNTQLVDAIESNLLAKLYPTPTSCFLQ